MTASSNEVERIARLLHEAHGVNMWGPHNSVWTPFDQLSELRQSHYLAMARAVIADRDKDRLAGEFDARYGETGRETGDKS